MPVAYYIRVIQYYISMLGGGVPLLVYHLRWPVGTRDQVSVVIDGTSSKWSDLCRDRTLEAFQSARIQLSKAKAM